MKRFLILTTMIVFCLGLLAGTACCEDWNVARAKTVLAFAEAQEQLETPAVPVDGKCQDCYGTGKRGDGRTVFTCPTCKGIGKIKSGAEPPVVQQQMPAPLEVKPRTKLPIVNTPWGTIDLERYRNDRCNCPMCRGIRQIQSEMRQDMTSVDVGQESAPEDVAKAAIDLLQLDKDDVLADLGCGDGRVLVDAVTRYHCSAIGIEIDPVKADAAKLAVRTAGLDDRIKIKTADIRDDSEWESATAIYSYLYPELLGELAPRLKAMRKVVTPYHQVPGLQMKQYGDVWMCASMTAEENRSESDADEELYGIMFTADWCSYCRLMDGNILPFASLKFQKEDCTDRNPDGSFVNSRAIAAGINGLPYFFICDRERQTVLVKWEGYKSVSQVEDLILQARTEKHGRDAIAASVKMIRQDAQEYGSGTVIRVSDDGSTALILTAAHVVGDSANVSVQAGDETFPATVIKRDAEHDLAAVVVKTKKKWASARVGKSHSVGNSTLVVGYPFGGSRRDVRSKIGLSTKQRRIDGQDFMTFEASPDAGMSGGGVFVDGELTGVVVIKDHTNNIGWAVTTSDVQGFLQGLDD